MEFCGPDFTTPRLIEFADKVALGDTKSAGVRFLLKERLILAFKNSHQQRSGAALPRQRSIYHASYAEWTCEAPDDYMLTVPRAVYGSCEGILHHQGSDMSFHLGLK